MNMGRIQILYGAVVVWIYKVICVGLGMAKSMVNVKQSNYRPGQTYWVSGGGGFQISRQSADEGGKVVSPTHRPPLRPRNYSLYSFVVFAR
jgi:hypothetical protein